MKHSHKSFRAAIAILMLVLAPVGAQVVTLSMGDRYIEDFEGSQHGWTTSGTLWELGTPMQGNLSGAHSGTNAWATNLTGNYTHGADESIVSPAFDFTACPSDPILSLYIRHRMSYNDGFRVEVDLGDGAGFRQLGGLDWYDHTLVNAGQIAANPILGQAWTCIPSGTLAPCTQPALDWTLKSHAIDGAAGRPSVRLRIRVGTDLYNGARGAVVDDVSIESFLCPGTEGVSGDDFTQTVSLAGVLQPGSVHTVAPGTYVTFNTLSPGGTFTGTPVVIAAEVAPTGTAPLGLFPAICHTQTGPAYLILLGNPTAVALPSTGLPISFAYSGGLTGLSATIQSVVYSASAANGAWATNDAVELRFQ